MRANNDQVSLTKNKLTCISWNWTVIFLAKRLAVKAHSQDRRFMAGNPLVFFELLCVPDSGRIDLIQMKINRGGIKLAQEEDLQ